MKGITLKNILLLIGILLLSLITFSKISEPQKIIEENDLLIVSQDAKNIPLKYQKIINAVGNIMYNENDENGNFKTAIYDCTGTHLGGGYVLTAGHCVGASSKLTASNNCHFISGEGPFETPDIIIKTVDFGYRENAVPIMKSDCQEIIAALKDPETGFDFAILKVSPYPAEFILPDMIRRAAMGDTISIFSHPKGDVLHWSKTCGIERILHPDILTSIIQHQCDTMSGSSGAAIMNALSLKIVGVHGGGLNDLDNATGMPLKTGMNYGTYVLSSPLYNELKKLGF